MISNHPPMILQIFKHQSPGSASKATTARQTRRQTGPSDNVQPPGPGGDTPSVNPTDRTNRPNKFDGSQYEQAVEEARKQNKPLVMVFGSPGCGYCVQMDRNAWPDQGVQQLLNDKAIFVHVNVAETPGLASQYRMAAIQQQSLLAQASNRCTGTVVPYLPGQLRSTLGQYLQQ